jgi:hypothetical protein
MNFQKTDAPVSQPSLMRCRDFGGLEKAMSGGAFRPACAPAMSNVDRSLLAI